MDTLQIIGQIIGFFAIVIAFVSFQAKRRSSILLIQSVSNLIWSIHFFMIGAAAGGFINAYCVIRNIIYAQRERWRWVDSLVTPSVIAAGSVVILFLSVSTWVDYLIIPSTIVSSIAFYLRDEKKMRAFSVFISMSWLVFNIVEFSISGICAEIFNLTSITVAMIRFRKFRLMTASGAELPPKSEVSTNPEN